MKIKISLFLVGLLAVSAANAAVDSVFVGDAGNPNDPTTGYGQVNYDYHIGTHEVTNAQYTSFLNATAATDNYRLYNTGMANPFGGITRSGTSGSYSYSTIDGRENNPVNYVSFWDAARFTNWLTTGNTETGVYVLTGDGIANNTITRDATAWANGGVAITSENEWYKAAYYQPASDGGDIDNYWLYPTQSNSITEADALYSDGYLVPVGTYANNASYYGTFDQGGNVFEWNDEILSTEFRVLRGGSVDGSDFLLQSSNRYPFDPIVEGNTIGFRVSSLEPIIIPVLPSSPTVPEPSTYAAILGGLGLLIVLLRRK